MPDDPFKPPETDSSQNPLPPAGPGSPLRAVLMGLAVDIGGTTVLGLVIGALYGLQLQGQGLSESEMKDAMTHMPHDSALYVLGILLGALMSVAGGYVCARIVRRNEFRTGFVMAGCSVLFGILSSAADDPADMLLLFTLATIACNLLGVKFGAEHNRRAEAPAAAAKDASTP